MLYKRVATGDKNLLKSVVSTLSINVALESVVKLYLLDCCEKSAPSGTLCHAKGSHFVNVLLDMKRNRKQII